MSRTPHEGPSDDAVRDATGRDWREWEVALDQAGGERLSHKELVAWLAEEGEVESGWWQQTVAVGYEKRKGKRVVGQTADGLFQIGVQRTLPIGHQRAWELLTSPEGVAAWLGDVGATALAEGEPYTLTGNDEASGTTGEIRVVKPGSHVRLTRNPGDWDRPSTIQVRVEPKGDRTVIGMHEENLPGRERTGTPAAPITGRPSPVSRRWRRPRALDVDVPPHHSFSQT